MERVIKLMDSEEQLKLTIISKKMSRNVKFSIPKKHKYEMSFGSKISKVLMSDKIEVTSKELKKCMPQKKEKETSPVSATLTAFHRIQYSSPKSEYSFILHPHKMSNKVINEILEIPKIGHCNTIEVVGGKLKKTELDKLMELRELVEKVEFCGTKFPKNYFHSKAFNSKTVSYFDATWVKIENLYSTGSQTEMIRLGKNKLTSKDLNSLLKYWTTSEHDLFREIHIDISPGKIDFDEIFEGLLALFMSGPPTQSDIKHGFILVEPMPSREQRVLFVHSSGKILSIASFRSTSLLGDINPRSEYDVLNTLHRKRALEQQETSEETRAELQQLYAQLLQDRVIFVNGQAWKLGILSFFVATYLLQRHFKLYKGRDIDPWLENLLRRFFGE